MAISPAALASSWVNHELNTALSLEIASGKPKVLPIIVAEADIPAAIRSRLYLDMSGTMEAGKSGLRQAVNRYLPELEAVTEPLPAQGEPELILTSVTLRLSARTDKYFGGIHGEDFSKSDVEEEIDDLRRLLRRKANGILLNFISATEMDFSSPHPKFSNGQLSEATHDSGGEFVGTFAKEAVVDVEIINPDEGKLSHLVSSKLASLGVSKAVYSFLLSPPVSDLAKQALNRLQDQYVILGWDSDDGADVELPDDLKLSVHATAERVRIGIETKYAFQFEKRAKEFSVRQFAAWIAGLRDSQKP